MPTPGPLRKRASRRRRQKGLRPKNPQPRQRQKGPRPKRAKNLRLRQKQANRRLRNPRPRRPKNPRQKRLQKLRQRRKPQRANPELFLGKREQAATAECASALKNPQHRPQRARRAHPGQREREQVLRVVAHRAQRVAAHLKRQPAAVAVIAGFRAQILRLRQGKVITQVGAGR